VVLRYVEWCVFAETNLEIILAQDVRMLSSAPGALRDHGSEWAASASGGISAMNDDQNGISSSLPLESRQPQMPNANAFAAALSV
jgi:hypothetical protein